MKVLFPLFFMLMAFPNLHSQQVIINEFMSDNERVITDADGDYSDWIELYNPGNTVVDLSGYHLSDRLNELDMWTFPAMELAPKAFLLVFASGKNILDNNELHSNFKINDSGEDLILSDNDHNILSHILPVELKKNISYGCVLDGTDPLSTFEFSTPGFSNDSNWNLLSSHESGFYNEVFNLTLSVPSAEYSIRYTTDGSSPSLQSPIYSNSIPINFDHKITDGLSFIPTTPTDITKFYTWKSPTDSVYKITTIRYQPYRNGVPLSEVKAKTFIVNPQGHERYSFPIVSIITDSDNLFGFEDGIHIPGKKFEEKGWENGNPWGNYLERGDTSERPIHFQFLERTNNDALGIDLSAGIRIHGNYTRRYEQKGLKVYFRKKYGEEKLDYPILEDSPINEFKKILLKNKGPRTTLFVDHMQQKLYKDLDIGLQHSRFVIVFINGEYWGIFAIMESQDEYYLKYRYDLEEDDVILTNACGLDGDNNYQPIHGWLTSFVKNTDWTLYESFDQLDDRINVDGFIDYMIVQLYNGNFDWPGNNYKTWRTIDPSSKWQWLLYDLDHTFGRRNGGPAFNSVEHATKVEGPSWPNPDCSTRLFRSALMNPIFQTRFLNRLSILLNTTLSKENVLDLIEQSRAELLPEMEEHNNRWNMLEDMATWEDNVAFMREFARERPCYLRQHILDYLDLNGNALDFNDNCLSHPVDTIPVVINTEIKLYPNPGKSTFFLEYNPEETQLKEESIKVYQANGQLVKEVYYYPIEVDEISFSLSGLQNGLYILHFPTEEGDMIRKITIFK